MRSKSTRRSFLRRSVFAGAGLLVLPHSSVAFGYRANDKLNIAAVGAGGMGWADLGNMTSENINYRNFLNYTWLSLPVAEHCPSEEDLFGDYLKKWGRD